MYEEKIAEYADYNEKDFTCKLKIQDGKELEFYNNVEFLQVASMLRTNIVLKVDLKKNWIILKTLVENHNQFRTNAVPSTSGLTPKTPDKPASALYGPLDESNAYQLINIDDIKIYSNDGTVFGPLPEMKWIEDYFETFSNSRYISTKLPMMNVEGSCTLLKDKLNICRINRGLTEIKNKNTGKSLKDILDNKGMQTLLPGTFTVPDDRSKNLLLLSYIEGGNMLAAEDYIIIGRDSLDITCFLNGIDTNLAIELIAKEMNFPSNAICFVEQPDYHIDCMIMHLGKGRVMVKASNQGIPLSKTISDLCDFAKIKNVYVAFSCEEEKNAISENNKIIFVPEDIAGYQNKEGVWEYNFYNGEYVRGRDGQKIYYVTNDCSLPKAKERFIQFMKEKAEIENVLFDHNYPIKTFNEEQGGFGCAHKAILQLS